MLCLVELNRIIGIRRITRLRGPGVSMRLEACGFVRHIQLDRVPYVRHNDIFIALGTSSADFLGLRQLTEWVRIFRRVSSDLVAPRVRLPAGSFEDGEIQWPQGGEAAADDYTVDFGTGGVEMLGRD